MEWGMSTLLSTMMHDAEVFSCIKKGVLGHLIKINFETINYQFQIQKIEKLKNTPCLQYYLKVKENEYYIGYKIWQSIHTLDCNRYILLKMNNISEELIDISLIIVINKRTIKAKIPKMMNSLLQVQALLLSHPDNNILGKEEYDICWRGFIGETNKKSKVE